MSVDIPKVVEGYATCRVVLFSHGAAQPPSLRNDDDPASALQNLDALRGSVGVELSTNGESDIASVSWKKDLTSPAGAMHVSLYPRKDYLNLIQPNDVLIVYMKADKFSPESLLALVSVDTVSEVRGVSNGATTLLVSVQGRDLGKVLMDTPTVFDTAFGGFTISQFYQIFLRAFSDALIQGGPSSVVQVMLAIFFSLKQNFVTLGLGQALPFDSNVAQLAQGVAAAPLQTHVFPGHPTSTLLSFLDIESFVQKPMVGACVTTVTLLQDAANLWALCDMYANRLVNEFFIDTRDLVPGYDDAHKRAGYYAQRFLQRYGEHGGRQLTESEQLGAALAPVEPGLDDVAPLNAVDLSTKKNMNTGSMPSVVALVHRQMPYDTYSFYALPTTLVYETEVHDGDLNRSSHDVVNLFRIRMPGAKVNTFEQDQVFGVPINRESIRRFGIKRFEAETIYPWTSVGDKEKADFGQAPDFRPTFLYYMSLVTTWYAYNERLYTTSLKMRLRPDIRVGTRLTYVRTHNGEVEVFDFYVQSVQHMFSPQPGASHTMVELVRGIRRGDDLYLNESQPEAGLFWTDAGSQLTQNPYEVVLSQDQVGLPTGAPAQTDPEGGEPEPEQAP